MSDPTPIVHAGLVWLRADAAALDLLLADAQLGRMVAARVAPDLAAVRVADRERVLARLAKLGQTPRIVGVGG